MKSKETHRVLAVLVAGLLMFSFFLIEDVGAGKGRGGGGGGEEETSGNCLSYPVIFATEHIMSLRGAPNVDAELGGASTLVDGVEYFHQQDPANIWQADWQGGGSDVAATSVNWGDNLEARPWRTTSMLRVEAVLYKTIGDPMTGYQMGHIEGQGVDEMWGTDGIVYDCYKPTVYASDAQITVQYMGDEVPSGLVWEDSDERTWGPGAGEVVMMEDYSAEVNIQGKVIHGCLWNLRTTGVGEGYYRITMSFGSGKTIIDGNTEIEAGTEESSDGSAPQGGVASVDPSNNLTYIDVLITQGSGKGGGGGKSGGGGKGGGGSKGSGRRR